MLRSGHPGLRYQGCFGLHPGTPKGVKVLVSTVRQFLKLGAAVREPGAQHRAGARTEAAVRSTKSAALRAVRRSTAVCCGELYCVVDARSGVNRLEMQSRFQICLQIPEKKERQTSS